MSCLKGQNFLFAQANPCKYIFDQAPQWLLIYDFMIMSLGAETFGTVNGFTVTCVSPRYVYGVWTLSLMW